MKHIEDYSEKLSVLIIEDNPGDFVLIEDYLLDKFKAINIKQCIDYASSVKYLKSTKEKPSIILLDLNLPDMQGVELIWKLIENNFQVPIIILTGYSDLEITKSSLQIGVSDYLVKDEIDPGILYKTIIFALNRSSFINQIKLEKQNYETLFDFNPQPTWLLDANTLTILNANIAAQKLYSYTLDEFLKKSFTKLHPENEIVRLKIKFKTNEIEIITNHFTHILRNGTEIKVDIYHKEVNTNSYAGLIVQSNDVSEMLNHINTIETQNAKLKEISWTQSHVVRAPLSRIMGIINLIEMDTLNNDELMFYLKQLRISSNEMDDIIKNIVEQSMNNNYK